MTLATRLTIQVLCALPRRRLSHAVGSVCERPLPASLSRAVQRAYVRIYGVDMTDVAPHHGTYPTIDAFFTRPLRPGARPISHARVVAPADGRLVALGRIEPSARFRVKAQDYTADDLIGEPADFYVGGSYAVVYVAPRDYHLVHAPVDGAIRDVRGMSGDIYPVNTLGERHVPRQLVRNERVIVFIETQEFGRVAVVLVGASCVGRITVRCCRGTSCRTETTSSNRNVRFCVEMRSGCFTWGRPSSSSSVPMRGLPANQV